MTACSIRFGPEDSNWNCPICKGIFVTEEENLLHRPQCYQRHKRFIDGLPADYPKYYGPQCGTAVRCPRCGSPLKQWPAISGYPINFKCQASDPDCPFMARQRFIYNDGKRRFRCFACDFDICRDCLEFKQVKERRRMIIQADCPGNNDPEVRISMEDPPPCYLEAMNNMQPNI